MRLPRRVGQPLVAGRSLFRGNAACCHVGGCRLAFRPRIGTSREPVIVLLAMYSSARYQKKMFCVWSFELGFLKYQSAILDGFELAATQAIASIALPGGMKRISKHMGSLLCGRGAPVLSLVNLLSMVHSHSVPRPNLLVISHCTLLPTCHIQMSETQYIASAQNTRNCLSVHCGISDKRYAGLLNLPLK